MRFLLHAVIVAALCGAAGAAGAGLVINEIDYDQPGTDTAEFIELYNNGAEPVALLGLVVELVNGSVGATPYATYDLPDLSLAPGEFFVLCGNASNVPNCSLVVGLPENLIQNGAPDAVIIRQGVLLLDAVSYEGSVPGYVEGTGDTVVDAAAAFAGVGRYPDGADTDDNDADFTAQCATPGWPNPGNLDGCLDPLPEESRSWGALKAMYDI